MSNRTREHAFTIIDLLVSVAVIALLIALLLPSFAKVRQTTFRVVCSSNVRQIGLGLTMYADDYRDHLPPSRFMPNQRTAAPQEMMAVHLADGEWDGLGLLYSMDYLSAPGVFYCPAHTGNHPLTRYATLWPQPSGATIVSNYHFRGVSVPLSTLQSELALVADGMRTRDDYNHKIGSNVLRVNMPVGWFDDRTGELSRFLPQNESDLAAGNKVQEAWETLDAAGPSTSASGNKD